MSRAVPETRCKGWVVEINDCDNRVVKSLYSSQTANFKLPVCEVDRIYVFDQYVGSKYKRIGGVRSAFRRRLQLLVFFFSFGVQRFPRVVRTKPARKPRVFISSRWFPNSSIKHLEVVCRSWTFLSVRFTDSSGYPKSEVWRPNNVRVGNLNFSLTELNRGVVALKAVSLFYPKAGRYLEIIAFPALFEETLRETHSFEQATSQKKV